MWALKRAGAQRREPPAQPHKGKNQRQLQRHREIIGGLNGGQIQPQGQRQPGANKGGKAHHRNAADGEAKRQRQAPAGAARCPGAATELLYASLPRWALRSHSIVPARNGRIAHIHLRVKHDLR